MLGLREGGKRKKNTQKYASDKQTLLLHKTISQQISDW